MDEVLNVTQWSPITRREAQLICLKVLGPAGTREWEKLEIGETAIHFRRRLNIEEMRLLRDISPKSPVFTHGKACEVIAGEKR